MASVNNHFIHLHIEVQYNNISFFDMHAFIKMQAKHLTSETNRYIMFLKVYGVNANNQIFFLGANGIAPKTRKIS